MCTSFIHVLYIYIYIYICTCIACCRDRRGLHGERVPSQEGGSARQPAGLTGEPGRLSCRQGRVRMPAAANFLSLAPR